MIYVAETAEGAKINELRLLLSANASKHKIFQNQSIPLEMRFEQGVGEVW